MNKNAKLNRKRGSWTGKNSMDIQELNMNVEILIFGPEIINRCCGRFLLRYVRCVD